MKRQAGHAAILAYLGIVLIVVSFIPNLGHYLEHPFWLHALWHISIFAGAALLVYGLETLRSLARRYRRMTS